MAQLSERIDGDVRIVQFEDTQILDEHYAKGIGTRLIQISADMNESALLLNLEKVKFMASAMIGQLVILRENCRKKNIDLAVCSMNENLCEAIKLMRIDEIITIHDCEATAMSTMADEA